MPQLPLSPVTTPFYGGGQVPNPANVLTSNKVATPPTVGVANALGTIFIGDTENVYIAVGHASGATQWALVGSSGGSIETINTNAPVAGNYTLAGTTAQIAVAQTTGTTTFSLIGPYTPATYTAHGVLVGAGASSIVALSVGATGTVLAGSTGANPAFTGSPALSGNLTFSTSGDGVIYSPVSGSGTTTATASGRTGVVTITTPSIAGGATFTMTITNTSVTGSGTDVLYSLVGGTTGAALSIQSVTNSASTSAVVIQNGTGATTNTASLLLYFVVLN